MKAILISICTLLIPCLTFGQSSAYEEGSKILNVGLSLGNYSYNYYGNRTGLTIPLSASVEYGITDMISVGPYAGYARWSYKYNNGFGETKYSWSFLTLGARGSFHYTSLLNELTSGDINEEKVDLYVSLLLGIEWRSYKDSDGQNYYDNETQLLLGPNLGVRYLLGKNVGVYLEGGRGTFGWFNVGFTAKF